MKTNLQFWNDMELLIQSSSIIIDRQKHSAHPRYLDMNYPFDYGYLENTKKLTGILCTFDTLKRDAEIKLLIGCSAEDVETIIKFHNTAMKILYIPNPRTT